MGQCGNLLILKPPETSQDKPLYVGSLVYHLEWSVCLIFWSVFVLDLTEGILKVVTQQLKIKSIHKLWLLPQQNGLPEFYQRSLIRDLSVCYFTILIMFPN